MEQPQYNLFHRDRVEKELVPIYESENGLGTTVWSPLASGLLTGKYNNGMPDDSRLAHESMTWLRDMFEADHEQWASKLEKVRRLGTIAEGLDTSLAKLSLAWCLLNPNVSTVILGASKVSQLKENLSALEVVPKLTPVVRSAIEEVLS